MCRMQELVEVVGRCSGVVLMAPPDDSSEARATIATLLSALKSKQKVTGCSSHEGVKDDHCSAGSFFWHPPLVSGVA